MMLFENLFIDTSAWVAIADKHDAHHKKASSRYPSVLKTYRSMITSNLVIAETYVLFLKELGNRAALNFIEKVRASPRIVKVYSNEDLETEAEKILAKYSDQDFSFADAVSFAIMKEQKIKKVFCFDKHFRTAGFIII